MNVGFHKKWSAAPDPYRPLAFRIVNDRLPPKPLRMNILGRNLEYLIERFHALCSAPMLQTRNAVAPINNPQEKEKSNGLMDLLSRLRLHRETAS